MFHSFTASEKRARVAKTVATIDWTLERMTTCRLTAQEDARAMTLAIV